MNIVSRSRNYYAKGGRILSDFNKKISDNTYKIKNVIVIASLKQYLDLNYYINLFGGTLDLNSIPSNKCIDSNKLGVNAEIIIATCGKPDFIFNKNKLQIFVYKRKFNGLKIRLEAHFYTGQVFLFQYTYSKLEIEDKKHLVEKLFGEYLPDNDADFDIFDVKIADENNDSVFMGDVPSGLKITYLSSNKSAWFAGMKSEIKANEMIMKVLN